MLRSTDFSRLEHFTSMRFNHWFENQLDSLAMRQKSEYHIAFQCKLTSRKLNAVMVLPQSICVPMHLVDHFAVFTQSFSLFLQSIGRTNSHLSPMFVALNRFARVYCNGFVHFLDNPTHANATQRASSQKSLLSVNAISKCICILIKKIIYDACM